MNRPAAQRYIGLISGTSVDAIDAVLVEFEPRLSLIAAHSFPYPAELRVDILALSLGRGATSLAELGTLDTRIGLAFAAAANALLAQGRYPRESVRAIGSHGQTVWHAPLATHPFTTQLGDPNLIVEHTGLDTVADFRRRDIAAGGQGAPLVPAFHAAFLHDPGEDRAVLNLGGIANLSLLPAVGNVRGFDTGPANALLDQWAARHTGQGFDEDGHYAHSGIVQPELLSRLMADAYFLRPAPKSTGRDHFNLDWLASALGDASWQPQDVQATLLQLTARSVADALRAEAPSTRTLLVCGGGVRNARLVAAIAAALPGVAIRSTADFSIDPDHLEAMAFAWLARETLASRPGNLAAVTGARGPRILGGLYRA